MSRLSCFIGLGLSVFVPAGVFAATHASAVVDYTPGGAGAPFQTPAAALGAPDGISGENAAASNYFGFPNVLSPFSSAYQGDEITQIGEGGQLTLQLSNYALVGSGKRLGVFTNAALIDNDYPNGSNSAVAQAFGGGSAQVRVSQNGTTWFDLGNVTFNVPNLFYVNAGPFDVAAPASPQLTDFGKPFEGTLSSFDGKNLAGTIAAFAASGGGYSGGGTWLDLSTSGLTQVGFVQFILPDDGNAGTAKTLAIDAVAVANGAAGASVPEPTSVLGLIALAGLTMRRRKFN